MMDDELIEKVARAVYECDAPPSIVGQSWPNVPAPYKESYTAIARAAIQAMKDAGWKSPDDVQNAVHDGIFQERVEKIARFGAPYLTGKMNE
jgi:hypothetical protein